MKTQIEFALSSWRLNTRLKALVNVHESRVCHFFVSLSLGSTPPLVSDTENNVIDCRDKGNDPLGLVISLEIITLTTVNHNGFVLTIRILYDMAFHSAPVNIQSTDSFSTTIRLAKALHPRSNEPSTKLPLRG